MKVGFFPSKDNYTDTYLISRQLEKRGIRSMVINPSLSAEQIRLYFLMFKPGDIIYLNHTSTLIKKLLESFRFKFRFIYDLRCGEVDYDLMRSSDFVVTEKPFEGLDFINRNNYCLKSDFDYTDFFTNTVNRVEKDFSYLGEEEIDEGYSPFIKALSEEYVAMAYPPGTGLRFETPSIIW